MDFFDDPELKHKYQKCKYIVKMWESGFKKKYGRIPSKYDIREADYNVRAAYHKYFQMKTAALEKTLIDVEEFSIEPDFDLHNLESNTASPSTVNLPSENVIISNIESQPLNVDQIKLQSSDNAVPLKQSDESVQDDSNVVDFNSINEKAWGEHLSKKSEKNAKVTATKRRSSILMSYSQKLYQGAKFNKRNPRKSQSFKSKSKDENKDTRISQSQPEKSTSEPQLMKTTDDLLPSLDVNFKIVQMPTKQNVQPLSFIQKAASGNVDLKSNRKINKDWLDRVSQANGLIQNDIKRLSGGSDSGIGSPAETETYGLSNLSFGNCLTENKYSVENNASDSDDFVANSEDESESVVSKIIKKRKLATSPGASLVNKTNSQASQDTVGLLNETANPTGTALNKTNQNVLKELQNTVFPSSHVAENQKNVLAEQTVPELGKAKKTRRKKNNATAVKVAPKPRGRKPKQDKAIVNENSERPVLRARKPVEKPELPEIFAEFDKEENEDAFHSDNDYDNDPNFDVNMEKRANRSKTSVYNFDIDSHEDEKVKKSNPKRKVSETKTRTKKESPNSSIKKNESKRKSGSKKDVEDVSEEENIPKKYIDVSLTSLPVSVPRIKLKPEKIDTIVNSVCKVSTSPPSVSAKKPSNADKKTQLAKQKLEQKIESGTLNENFVRIDITKKIYVRGKKTMNYSKFKKQQWRAHKKAAALCGPEMDMSGCDGGMLTCYKCGQVGHFARNCPVAKEDELLPLEADTGDVSPFITLKEAAEMARKSVRAIHTTRIKDITSSQSESSQFVDNSNMDQCNQSDSENLCNIENSETPADVQDESDFECVDELELVNVLEVLEAQGARYPVPEDIVRCMSNTVQPLYETKPDGSLIDTPSEVFEALNTFGHTSFRPGQERAIMRVLSGKSTLVTLSTGSGKSLCYQLPAMLYSKHRRPSITLVVSPLVALMEDQVAGATRTACLHTNMTESARKKAMDKLRAGDIDALLVSPEAIVAGIDKWLTRLPPISFACIDEVHCVSQWSHNFRPSYLTVCRVLRENLGVKVFLGLTATAPQTTQRSIVEHLGIPDGDEGLIGTIPLPDNLTLTVSKDSNRDAALIELLRSSRLSSCRSIIIYCTRREECTRLAGLLRTYFKDDVFAAMKTAEPSKKRKRTNWTAEAYHAGLSASRRRSVQNAFMSGELRIVVATVAFGMGINKADIRAVIHYNMARNLESYVQEVGRAGRDGFPAYCHMFLDSKGKDQSELRRHIYANSMDRHVIRKLLQKVFVPCECKKDQCPRHEVAFSVEETVRLLDVPEENIATLLCYLELHEKRYIQVLSPAYTMCKVTSYAGSKALRTAAQNCAPLAMAIALEKQKGNAIETMNVLEFPVVDLAALIGWDSGVVKHHIKNLEWTVVNGQSKRSPLTVSFTALGFRIRAPGDLPPSELDAALDFLYERVAKQERDGLRQLRVTHKALRDVAEPSFGVSDEVADANSNKLKDVIRRYFECEDIIEDEDENEEISQQCEAHVSADVRTLVCMYRDNNFTGRAVARIFHGIPSPNYPAFIWGKCRFWRAHMNVPFNILCIIAKREILRVR